MRLGGKKSEFHFPYRRYGFLGSRTFAHPFAAHHKVEIEKWWRIIKGGEHQSGMS